MAFVEVCSKQIYYEEYGTKNELTVVYLHGGPGESCRTYSYQAQILGDVFHVIIFDQYGVFRSEAISQTEKGDVEFHVAMIEQIRLALGIKSWIPIGHSFGGMLALVYAHTYPNSIDAVIYDCPMWSALHTARAIAKTTLPYFKQNGITEQVTLVSEILNDGISPNDAFNKAMCIKWTNELNRFCHVIESTRYNKYISDHIPESQVTDDCWEKYIPFSQKLFNSQDFYFDYLPYLADICKPQLLIVGEYDMTCGKFEQEWFKNNTPNGKTEILFDSAHLSWFEHPKKYTNLITQFLISLR